MDIWSIRKRRKGKEEKENEWGKRDMCVKSFNIHHNVGKKETLYVLMLKRLFPRRVEREAIKPLLAD